MLLLLHRWVDYYGLPSGSYPDPALIRSLGLRLIHALGESACEWVVLHGLDADYSSFLLPGTVVSDNGSSFPAEGV